MKKLDLSGEHYGDLEVISYSRTSEKGKMRYFTCRCACGNLTEVSLGNLRSGHTKSCGCNLYRKGKDNPNFMHGMVGSKPFKAWSKIKERCYNRNDISYQNYGAKGITMSENFRSSFMAFYKEVGEPPDSSSEWSIDRVDNNKGYVEDNLQWATCAQQARNKGKMKNNTSGETGVQFYHSGKVNHTTYVVVTWSCNVSGEPKNKKFSVRKLGLMPAFKAAVEYRRGIIEHLNTQGAGYTENHGK